MVKKLQVKLRNAESDRENEIKNYEVQLQILRDECSTFKETVKRVLYKNRQSIVAPPLSVAVSGDYSTNDLINLRNSLKKQPVKLMQETSKFDPGIFKFLKIT